MVAEVPNVHAANLDSAVGLGLQGRAAITHVDGAR
jgi:hypothetical protein